MRLVRQNTFETNSSSTHALVIPHKVDNDNYNLYDCSEHNYEFGRDEYRHCNHFDEKLAYTYYVLNDYVYRYKIRKKDIGYGSNIKVTKNDIKKFKNIINDIYDELVSKAKYKPYDSDPTPNDIFSLVDNIDKIKKIYEPLRNKITWDSDIKKRILIIDEDEEEYTYRELTDEENEAVDFVSKFPEFFSYSYAEVFVDHTEDFGTNGFIEKILTFDREFLKKFIFNSESYINVGGDESMGYNIATIGFQRDYDSSKYPEYQVNEKGERCPDRSSFPDTDKGWDEYFKTEELYPITRDNGGFWDKLHEYEKENDVFLKGN